jgi:broad specificity phosphatase PhoE
MLRSQTEKRMKLWKTVFSVLLAFGTAMAARADLTIYYLRHAEGGHNVIHAYQKSGTPRSKWPAYVGNPDIFTPKGEKQAAAVPALLEGKKFDLVAVSPLWRTRHTVLPYLRSAKVKAEIWPELEEVTELSPSSPGPSVDSPEFWEGIEAVKIPEDEAAFFGMRGDVQGGRRYAIHRGGDADVMARKVEELLRARFGKKDATVLLVGHGASGSVLIRHLLRQPHWKGPRLENARLWMARENSRGGFDLLMLNNAPCSAAVPAPENPAPRGH